MVRMRSMPKQHNWIPWLYLAVVLTQAAHSVEEVMTGLWKNLPMVTSMVHARLPMVPVLQGSATGFVAANLVIVVLMLGLTPFVFHGRPWALKVVRIAAFIEVLNGLIHIIPAVVTGGYWSGSVTAVFLLGISLFLLFKKGIAYEH